MAEAVLQLNCAASGVVDSLSPGNNVRPRQFAGVGYAYDLKRGSEQDKRLYLKFAAFPDAYKYNRIYSVSLVLPVVIENNLTAIVRLYAPLRDFDPLTITYNTRTAGEELPAGVFVKGTGNVQSALLPDYILDYETDKYKQSVARKLLKYSGAYISVSPTYPGDAFYAFDETYRLPPRLSVRYDDTEIVTSEVIGNGKTSGYVNPHNAQSFAWAFSPAGEYYCAGDWSQTAATFYWRSGTDGAWTAVAASGASQDVTIPAETMPVGTVQWYVEATDDQGTTSSSPVYTISTADSLQVATPLSPIGTIEDASAEIILRWQEANDSGTSPTGADIQISSDGSTWSDLAHVAGTATQYTAPAGTFLGGTAYWRVRAYNIDNVAGPWSEAAAFVSVAAPPAPIVTAEEVPFAVISWQSDGQEAYRVTVDGKVYGPYFGRAKSFTLPDYLADGQHTVTVEVQGAYGLWSQPGTATFTVQNAPGDPVSLRGVFYRDTTLTWETESGTADFLVYRDGAQIGHTTGNAFTDRTALGAHSWQIINRLPDGNYTASNAVQGELTTCCPALALLSGGDWLELRKSASSSREEAYTEAQSGSVRHFAGEIYPSVELSPYRDKTVSFEVAWIPCEADAARRFEALIGKPIIYKGRGSECFVGVMLAQSRRDPRFFRAYSATVQRIHWRDYVDDALG